MAIHKPMRSCRLEDSLYLKVKYVADKENRSFNNLLEVILQQFVEDYEKQHGTIDVDTDDLYQ